MTAAQIGKIALDKPFIAPIAGGSEFLCEPTNRS